MDKIIVKIPIEKIEKIKKFATKLAKSKIKEAHFKVDSQNIAQRFITGLMGEAALEELLGIEIINWTIGKSTYYNNPDIAGLRVGIKTTKHKYPCVRIKPEYPEIICRIISETEVEICGLATVEVMKEHQDPLLIRNGELRARGVKAGFTGFDYLLKFKNLKQLKKLLEKVMPHPKKNEKYDEFIGRCMGYEDMQKYPPEQRRAICESYWEEHKKKKGFLTGRQNDRSRRDLKTGKKIDE